MVRFLRVLTGTLEIRWMETRYVRVLVGAGLLRGLGVRPIWGVKVFGTV